MNGTIPAMTVMTNYKKRDIVVTDFPYSDTAKIKRRPVLVVSNPFKVSKNISIFWVLMITTTELKGYQGDFEILDLKKADLPHPSIVRAIKIANIQNSIIKEKIGVLDPKIKSEVEQFLLTNIKTT